MKLQDIIKLNYQQLLFVIMAFVVMVGVSYLYTSSIVRAQLFSNGEEAIKSAQIRIQAELNQAGVFLKNTGFFVERMILEEKSSEALESALKQLTQWNAGKGATLIKGFGGIYGLIQGVFVSGHGWIPPGTYDPRTRPWYIGADAAQGKLFYSDPYIDSMSGDTIVSVSQKIMDTSETLGILAININISEMLGFITELNLGDDGYGIILDNTYKIVLHGLSLQWRDRSFPSISPEYARLTRALAENDTISGMEFTNHYGVKSIIFFRKLFNDWHIGLVTSTSSYYRDVYRMAILLSLLGTVLVSILCYFLLRLYTDKIRSDEKNKSKSNFLAKMSHEIRTPMNAIVGMAELILREPISREVYEHAMSIKHASANLLSIINDILDFSKIESGKMEISNSSYLLSSVINDIVTIIRMRLTEKPVILLVSIDAKLPNKLRGDEVRIRQIILNVLNNAVKYTEKGSITLSITGVVQDTKQVLLTISVEDTGTGIKKENFAKIFGDFTQFDKERNRGIEGTGLGLAITKNLCKALGGEISFTSEYGKGSTFTILMPQSIEGPEPLAVVEKPEAKQVLLYALTHPYVDSIIGSLENLGLKSTLVQVQSDFHDTLKEHSYGFIFVSQVLYEGAKHLLERMGIPTKLVMMVEYGAELNGIDVCTLTIPAHAISIAEVLNHKSGNRSTYRDPRETGVRFIAPTARILLVDDIITNLKVAEGLMAPYKMQVDSCKSGPEAIRLVQTKSYDIIFMDHMMPEMDGIEAAGIIRNLEGKGNYYQELPIIALTANAVSGVKEMFLQNSMNDFLSKPIEISRLNSILQKWIPEAKREKYQEHKKEGFSMDKVDAAPCQDTPDQGVSGKEPELPLIAGVAVSRGIGMTGGSLDMYMDILGIFWAESKEKLEQLNACLAAGDMSLYTTYVHAVKSTAATIGAQALAERAKALEVAGRSGDRAYIEQYHGPFFEDFSKVLEGIGHALQAYESQQKALRGSGGNTGEAGADREVLQQDLRELKAALDMMDVGKADESIGRLQKGDWGEPVNRGIAEIARHILLSDYDEAIAAIETLLADEPR
ncbi:MAG: response regulator [Treponema sp.]|jgi:signal transduction histidine kinase/CheY-like chemotaxis protein/HPt (histidine-containing phosphotransfer) domain-containing protein|nr:response regulator [Treponema sp.]